MKYVLSVCDNSIHFLFALWVLLLICGILQYMNACFSLSVGNSYYMFIGLAELN